MIDMLIIIGFLAAVSCAVVTSFAAVFAATMSLGFSGKVDSMVYVFAVISALIWWFVINIDPFDVSFSIPRL